MENLFKMPADLYYKSKIIGKWPTLTPFMKAFYRVMWGDFSTTAFVRARPLTKVPPNDLISEVIKSNDLHINRVEKLIPMGFVSEDAEWHSLNDPKTTNRPIFVYESDGNSIYLELLLSEWPIELLEGKTEARWYKFNIPMRLTVHIGQNESTTELVLPIQVEFCQAYSSYMVYYTFFDDVIACIKEGVE